MSRNLKKCKLVHLTFWDHASHNGEEIEPIECELVGWLYKESDIAYYIACWICDKEIININTDSYAILKSTVIKKKVLG